MGLSLTKNDQDLERQFYALKTPEDVAKILDVKYSYLIYYLYRYPKSKQYSVFNIAKKNGDARSICAPSSSIKVLQKKMNQILQVVYKPKLCVHSFVKNKNIVTNAKLHAGKRYVLNVDLQDFFPSINFGRVRGMFLSVPYHLPPKVATILAQLCCYKNTLPQGAPSSPIISNMICRKLDSDLKKLSIQAQCQFSRYADDITFSCNQPDFPTELVERKSTEKTILGQKLEKIITSNGFRINEEKIRLQDRKINRQMVTGLIVNKFPNVKRKYTNQIRAMLHALEKYGEEKSEDEFRKKFDKKSRFNKCPKFKSVLKGKLNFLSMVKSKDDSNYIKFRKKARSMDEITFGPVDDIGRLHVQYQTSRTKDAQTRGYELEGILNKLLEIENIETEKPFRRNSNAEQIDGAFSLDGNYYIVECKWKKKLSNQSEIDSLSGTLGRGGSQTVGVFLSVMGWSENVPTLIKQNPSKNVILFSEDDLLSILREKIHFSTVIHEKMKRLNFHAEPYYSTLEMIKKLKKVSVK